MKVCFIPQVQTSILLATRIVIGVEIWMKGKAQQGLSFFMGDISFTWSSKKQSIVTLSSCEAEYVAANSAVCHLIWLRNMLKHLGFPQESLIEIYVDNRSVIALAKTLVYHERSKHIDTHNHFIREHVKNKEI